MNLKYLPSPLFISISGGKTLLVGGADLRRRRGDTYAGKGESALAGVRKTLMIGLTVLV